MPVDYSDPNLSHRHKGHAIEQLAEDWLSQQGLTLVERNFTLRGGEIDLIMWQGDVLVFVEVRYRQSQAYGGAAHSIGATKLGRLQRSAEYYIQQHRISQPCRIDAVLIHGGQAPEWLTNITG